MKFLALNVDFDSPSPDFLCSRKPAHEGIKKRYLLKVLILPLLASLSWKRLQIGMGMLSIATSIVTSFLVWSISMTMKDPELSKRRFYWFLYLRPRRTLPGWIPTKWLERDRSRKYLRSGTAIGFRASREHWLKFFVVSRAGLENWSERKLLGFWNNL